MLHEFLARFFLQKGIKYPLLGLLIFSSEIIPAQDIHFSNFNSTPLFINPANSGNFDGRWRLAGIYREQWRALSDPFTTASLSFDKNINFLNQKVGAGAYFLTDQSGAIGLTSNKLYVSLALERSLNKHNFKFGLQTGMVFRSFGNSNLTYPADYNHNAGEFNGENNSGEKKAYLDINAGILWKTGFRIFEPEAGIAFSHLNGPNESFFDEKEKLPVRMTFHGKVKTKLIDRIYVQPSLLLLNQKKAKEMMLGTDIGFRVFKKRSNVKEVFLGFYMRDGYLKNTDAFAITGGATIGRIDLMLGYDINISNLKLATGNKGAFEISFIYKSISTVLNSYSIPCERF